MPEYDEEPEGLTADDLHFLVERQQDLLGAVATGAPIDDYNAEYKRRRGKIKRGLARLDVADPFPWPDLWQWWTHLKTRYHTYADRRAHLADITEPVLERLDGLRRGVTDWGEDEPREGWEGVEGRLEDLKQEYAAATTTDGWQDVGRRAREIIGAAATIVFEESMVPPGAPIPPIGRRRTPNQQIVIATRMTAQLDSWLPRLRCSSTSSQVAGRGEPAISDRGGPLN